MITSRIAVIIFLRKLLIVFGAYGFLLPLSCFSQSVEDKIERIVNETEKDSNRIIKLYQLANTLLQNDQAGSKLCNQRLFDVLQEIPFPKGYGFYYYNLGTHQIMAGNYQKAIQYYDQAIDIFEKSGDTKMQLKSLRYKATALNFEGQYHEVIVTLLPTIETFEFHPKYQRIIGEMMVSVGGAKMRLKLYHEAIVWYQKANVLFKKINHHFGSMQADSEIGLLYYKLENYPKALEYYLQSEETINAFDLGSNSTFGLLYAFKARVYLRLKKFSEAQYFHNKSFALHQKLKNQSLIGLNLKIHLELLVAQKKHEQVIQYGQNYLLKYPNDNSLALDFNYSMGTSYLALQQWNQAEEKLKLAKKAFDFSEVITDIKYADVVDALLIVHQSKDQLTDAYNILQEATTLKIEKLEQEKHSKIHELILQYDVLNKDLKIKQNKIETQKKEIHIQKQNYYLQLLFFTGIFVILALITVLCFLKLSRKKNKLLTEQKVLIQNANAELSNSLMEKEVLLKEIHHRVKNNLQLVSSLLSIQASESESLQSFLDISQSRLQTMALIHENLYNEGNLSQINFNAYIKQIFELTLRTYKKPGQTIELFIDCPEVKLDVQTAIPLGLILNEIICNAFKHAFPQQRSGTLSAKFQYLSFPDQAQLIVQDNGIGYADDFQNDTMGTSIGFKLIKILSLQIQGTIQKIKSPQGTTYEIRFRI